MKENNYMAVVIFNLQFAWGKNLLDFAKFAPPLSHPVFFLQNNALITKMYHEYSSVFFRKSDSIEENAYRRTSLIFILLHSKDC